jgi:hypothetical protein
MPFQYACFISYRRGTEDMAKEMIEDLHNALAGEIELAFGTNVVFRDETRLHGGDFLNDSLAQALCHSVCMILVFTRSYFDKNRTYCAREYTAMKKLEQERLKLLPSDQRSHGLIIPIVFRGLKYLPPELKEHRFCLNFDRYLGSDGPMRRHPYYASQIKKVVEYIDDLYTAFNKLAVDPCESCDHFTFPTEEEVHPWLNTITHETIPFPIR